MERFFAFYRISQKSWSNKLKRITDDGTIFLKLESGKQRKPICYHNSPYSCSNNFERKLENNNNNSRQMSCCALQLKTTCRQSRPHEIHHWLENFQRYGHDDDGTNSKELSFTRSTKFNGILAKILE